MKTQVQLNVKDIRLDEYAGMKHTELDKLEQWLRENNWAYDRKVRPRGRSIGVADIMPRDLNVIVVYRKFPRDNERLFDAICNQGSFGYEEGLLEIVGECVVDIKKDGNYAVGYLTAEQVIERFKKWLQKSYEKSSN